MCKNLAIPGCGFSNELESSDHELLIFDASRYDTQHILSIIKEFRRDAAFCYQRHTLRQFVQSGNGGEWIVDSRRQSSNCNFC